MAYASTETQNASIKHAFWTDLDRAVQKVPKYEQLFVLMDANACMGRRKKGQLGCKDNKSFGVYGRDTLNDNGKLHVESRVYNFGALPSQISLWKMDHGSTAKINLLLSTEISESWQTLVIRVVEVKKKSSYFSATVFVIATTEL